MRNRSLIRRTDPKVRTRSRQPRFVAVRLQAFTLTLLAGLALGCRTVPPMPQVDLEAWGWQVHRGQAVWNPRRGAQEMAGELIVATHAHGRAFVQFTKEPFSIVTAQVDTRAWQVTFPGHGRSWRGRGKPPVRWLWLQLPRAVVGDSPEPPWQVSRRDPATFSLANPATGERLTGFLAP